MQAIRAFGNNCKWYLKSQNIGEENFADALGYSVADIRKLLDGRLFITEDDESAIADFFSVPIDELYLESNEPQINEEVLDILDMYCDLKEAL